MTPQPLFLRVVLALAGSALLVVPACWADAIVLKSGRRIEGTLRKTSTGWIVTTPAGAVTSVAESDVASVERAGEKAGTAVPADAPPGAAAASAADKLASLRRAVEAENDIDQVIQRLERFVAANPNTPAAEEARRDVALWRDRKARGMVRVGSRWVTPAERDALTAQLSGMVATAARQASGGQFRDAEETVKQILELDPRHISGLYLQGLILLNQDQVVPARKAFEAVNAQIEHHAPTLNNLAVIAFRQNQTGAALAFYEQAMAAAPADRTIIDNVAEALNATKDDQRRVPIAKRVARVHAEQEAALAAALARQDLYRWGATWVDRATLTRLQAEEQRIQQRVAELETMLAERKREVAITEDRIVATDRSLRSMEADRYSYSVDGRLLVMPLPTAYYEMQRDLQVLQGERLRQIAAVKQVETEVRSVKQDLPVPRYTGVQRPIGAEGTPVESAAGPATAPATKPS